MHDLFDMCSCEDDYENDAMPSDTIQMPLIGDPAPEFSAMTTNGPVNFPSDYAGKWVILFSHPSDFTPVCTSEFMAFQALSEELKELNTELIGLSVGSITSHLAWIDAIRGIKYRQWENMEITFPVIDDIGMKVAKKYGMIHPNASDTHAVRAVFIIDPAGIIRAILYYPASTGRNFDEIKRMLVALQTTDAFKVSTPADWRVGDDVLVASPGTSADMRRLMQNMRSPNKSADTKAWFFTFRPLPADDINAKLRKKPSEKQSKKKS